MTFTKEQLEVILLLENLIRVASRNNVYIAGFAFSDEPMMLVNFGNCSDSHELKLYQKLIEIRNKQLARGGEIEKRAVNEVN